MHKLVKAKQVSELIDTSVDRVYSLTREGLIPHVKVGERQYRYSLDSIVQWIEQGGNQQDRPAALTN